MMLIDALLIGVAIGLLGATTAFACRMVRMQDRLVSVATCMYEARMLAVARGRLRKRQQRVHEAFDTGAIGLEIAHRAVAHYIGGSQTGSGERFYEVAREINRGVDSVLSAWLAPRPSRGRSPSREQDDD